MARWPACRLGACVLAALAGVAVSDLTGQACTDAAEQKWKLSSSGALQGTAAAGEALECLTAGAKESAGIALSLQPCASPLSREQQWEITEDSFLVLSASKTMCANLEGYGKTPGTPVWGYTGCSTKVCKGNCDWHLVNASAGFSHLQNKGSGLCLDSKAAAPPPAPPPPLPSMRTCTPGSPAASLKFCDQSLSMEERAAALVANLTMAEKLHTFMLVGQLQGVPRLNVKSFRWDATDIEGVDDQVFKFNNTCYPHAIGIGATWDRELIREISQVTAIEARVLEEKYWTLHHGTYIGATSFDGGPLANVAYDPRCGKRLFGAVFISKRSVYQDRLGTNTGKLRNNALCMMATGSGARLRCTVSAPTTRGRWGRSLRSPCRTRRRRKPTAITSCRRVRLHATSSLTMDPARYSNEVISVHFSYRDDHFTKTGSG
jgi:hypothetical protein